MPPRNRKLTVVDSHKLLPAVRRTLDELELGPEDEGLRRLAEQYASTIDDASEPKEDESQGPGRPRKVSEVVAVLSELGPKLQSVLESLGASPKARAALTGKGGGGPGASAGESALERRRRESAERRERARKHGSEAVDASAP